MKQLRLVWLALLLIAGFAGGSDRMSTKTVTAQQIFQEVHAGKVYEATGFVASLDGASGDTYTDDVSFYLPDNTLIETDNVSNGEVPLFDPSADPKIYRYSKLLTAPAGATYSMRVPSSTEDDTHNVDWGPLEMRQATDKQGIVPGNVLSSHINNGTSELYDGGVDIPNPAGDFADDWERNDTDNVTWDTDHYQGTHSIRMDGTAPTELLSPLVRWPVLGEKPFYVEFAYRFTNATGLDATFKANYLDADRNILDVIDLVDASGSALAPVKDGDWHVITLYSDGSTASDDTSSLQIDVVGDGSGSHGDALWVDTFYVGSQINVLKASGLQFYDKTSGLPVTASIGVGFAGEVTVPALSVTGAFKADGGVDMTSGVLTFPDSTTQTTAAVAPTIPYDVQGFVAGMPGDFVIGGQHVAVRAFVLPSGLPGSQGYAAQSPHDGDALFDIQVNGVSYWTMTFPNGTNTATFTTTGAIGDTTINPGDLIQVLTSSPQDSRLADVSWTLFGTTP